MNESTILEIYIDLLDQVFEIEKKLESISQPNSISRNVHRIKEHFKNLMSNVDLTYENPLGETYKETRIDLEANIAGSEIDNLVVTEVIKPIIRLCKKSGETTIVRKGVVIVESKK